MKYDDVIGRRYPHILFAQHWAISSDVQYLLGKCDAMVRAIASVPLQPDCRKDLLNVSLSKGAQATTAIEGNTLTDEEVEIVAEGKALPPSKNYQQREVANILDAMNDILESVARDDEVPLITEQLIKKFHKAVGRELGEQFDAIPGRYRDDERVVGPYKCPQHQHVVELVRRLCEWLPPQFGFPSGQQSFADAVVQAIVTHVYVEWIHPFGDGNGRTGRLLEFYILLRAGNPDIASHILSNFYNETRSEYYRQLDKASKERDLTKFIAYAVQGYHDGLQQSMELVQSSQVDVAWKYLVHDKFADHHHRKRSVSKRRRQLVLNMELGEEKTPEQLALITVELARQYAVLSQRTLLRDLEVLKEMGLVAERKGRFGPNLRLLGRQLPRRRVGKAAA